MTMEKIETNKELLLRAVYNRKMELIAQNKAGANSLLLQIQAQLARQVSSVEVVKKSGRE